MGRHVERSYLVDLLNQCYLNQEKKLLFVKNSIVFFAKGIYLLKKSYEIKHLIANIQKFKIGL